MTNWQDTFRQRMYGFEASRPAKPGEVPISVKVRVTSGCFHREHSPHAYEIIDRHLAKAATPRAEFSFQEHESGPEILVYLAVTTAGLAFAKSVIDLVTTIIKARSESVKKGDRPSDAVEIIVRRVEKNGEFQEEKVLRFGHTDPVDLDKIAQSMNEAATKLMADDVRAAKPAQKKTPARSRGPKKRNSKTR